MFKIVLAMTCILHVPGEIFSFRFAFYLGDFFTCLISFRRSLNVQGLLCLLAVGAVLIPNDKSKDIKYCIC